MRVPDRGETGERGVVAHELGMRGGEVVGGAVTEFQPGDEVFGSGRGTLAEYACAAAADEGTVGGAGVPTSLSLRTSDEP